MPPGDNVSGGDAAAKTRLLNHAADDPDLVDPVDSAQVEDHVRENIVDASQYGAGIPA